jgi:phosphate transport system ATP-binding protein
MAEAKDGAPNRRNYAAPLIEVRNLSVWYDSVQALKSVSFDVYPREILAFIGPSGCGKTTALRSLNRMLDDVPGIRIEGSIALEGNDIYGWDIDPPMLRRHFGWVSQKPNPFTSSVYDNVAYGARIHGLAREGRELDGFVETCLRRANLWEEVKDHLHSMSGFDLSGGQQQRLCVARALSTNPDVLLLDEPSGSIDPISTAKLENLLLELKKDHAIVLITHSLMQARRIADRVVHFHLGRIMEIGSTAEVFMSPKSNKTREFVSGAFG